MGSFTKQRMVRILRRVDFAVHQRIKDGFKPGGAGFWGCNKEDIIFTGLKIFLTIDNSLQSYRRIPESLVLIWVLWDNTSLFRQRWKQVLKFLVVDVLKRCCWSWLHHMWCAEKQTAVNNISKTVIKIKVVRKLAYIHRRQLILLTWVTKLQSTETDFLTTNIYQVFPRCFSILQKTTNHFNF